MKEVVELAHLVAVAVEEGHEGGLGACGALDAAALEAGDGGFEVFHVHEEVLSPEAGPLAHRNHLCGLIVGVAEGG